MAAVWRETNPRMIGHMAVHDLIRDGRGVLCAVDLNTLMRYVCDHGADEDVYFEDATPAYVGCTVKALRYQRGQEGW